MLIASEKNTIKKLLPTTRGNGRLFCCRDGLLGREMKTDHFRGIREHVLPKHATFMLLHALITLGMGNQMFFNFPKYIMFLELKN